MDSRAAGVDGSTAPSDELDAALVEQPKKDDGAKDDSDSESDDDDELIDQLENEMEDGIAANSIVADQARDGGGGGRWRCKLPQSVPKMMCSLNNSMYI